MLLIKARLNHWRFHFSPRRITTCFTVWHLWARRKCTLKKSVPHSPGGEASVVLLWSRCMSWHQMQHSPAQTGTEHRTAGWRQKDQRGPTSALKEPVVRDVGVVERRNRSAKRPCQLKVVLRLCYRTTNGAGGGGRRREASGKRRRLQEDEKEWAMKTRKEWAFRAHEIMIYLQEVQVVSLKCNVFMFLWMCSGDEWKGEGKE